MRDTELYDMSVKVTEIIETAKFLLGLHLGRYRYLVDGSESKFNCSYARITQRLFTEEKEAEIARPKLKELHATVTFLLEALEAENEA